ncbi:MFS transporter [Corallococcus llansteffanensis]|uniref:MFS transporter n=1 Tax=Corallococcus llansteffanensis TaxID=2316731 RepID=A0A3A8QLX8_9BACT|nr:MFS transporter [Corallococcus llansteffanensis]RKH67890.1 MFS transporter [Corallococcus llansteffanensis]
MSTDSNTKWQVVTPFTAILLALGSIIMVQPIFQQIGADFGIPITDVRVSFSYCSLTYAVAFFLLGPLTDRVNLTRMAMFSALGLAGSVALCGAAPSFLLFNVGMGLMGAFAGGMVSPMFPYMARIAPPGKAGAYLGLCLSATVTGLIVGRTVLGILTGMFGWRAAMMGYSVPVILLAAALFRARALPALPGQKPSLGAQYGRSLKLLTMPHIVRRYVAGFLLFFAYLGALTTLTFYLVAPPFGLTVGQIGWLSLAGLGGAVIAPKAGALAQAYGASRVVRTGVVLVLASFGIMLLFQNVVAVMLGVLVLYTGVYACQPAVFYDVTTAIQPQQMGAASSLYLLSCLSGGSLGSYALGSVWQRWGWKGVMAAAGAATLGTLVLGAVGSSPRPSLARTAT